MTLLGDLIIKYGHFEEPGGQLVLSPLAVGSKSNTWLDLPAVELEGRLLALLDLELQVWTPQSHSATQLPSDSKEASDFSAGMSVFVKRPAKGPVRDFESLSV